MSTQEEWQSETPLGETTPTDTWEDIIGTWDTVRLRYKGVPGWTAEIPLEE